MNYLKIYKDICNRGQTERTLSYCEIHHIIPKCLNGDNLKNNLTTLSAKEHYIAHLLLTKIYPNSSNIQHAFGMMEASRKDQIRRYTSNQYDKMRRAHSNAMKNNNPMHVKETRDKVSKTKKRMFANGELLNPMNGAEARRKVSDHMKINNPMTRFPEKNHTVKRTVVYYEDGSVKEFAMKKQFMDTLNGLTHMQKRYKIEQNDLKEFGVIKIERFSKSEG
jgi:hypothetical protein